MSSRRAAASPVVAPVASAALAALAAASFLAGCGYSGSGPAKVQAWARQSTIVSDTGLVVDDVRRARLAVKDGAVHQLRTICAGLAYDVGTAYDTLPSPDQQLTDELNAADELLVSSAGACSQVSSVSSVRTRGALAKMTSGLAGLEKARERAVSLGVSWPGRI